MDLFSSFLTGQGFGIGLFVVYAFVFIFLGGGLFYLLIRPIVLWYFKVKFGNSRTSAAEETPQKDYSAYMPK